MFRKLSFSIPFLCAMALLPMAHSRNVFVMPPADGTLRPVTPFIGDPFSPGAGGIAAAQDTFMALATPGGGKYYFIGRSGGDTVVVTDSNYSVVNRRSLGTGATAAVMTPDGRYLIVLAGTAQVISTSNDTVIAQLSVGSNPNDLAVSRDGLRLFVTSSTGQLTSIDLNTFGVLGTLQNLGPTYGVSVGPNSLVYVAAQNILYELDPRDLTFRGGAGISLNAQPGKPAFLADSLGNLRVVMVNSNPSFGGSSLLTVDLGTRTFTPLIAGGIILDKIVPVSGSRLFATSANGALYDITVPTSITQASIVGVGLLSSVRSIAASNEFPNARYLYAALTGVNQLLRIDLNSNSGSGTFPLPGVPGPVSFTGPAWTGVPASMYLFNNGAFFQPSTQTLPLVVRIVDSLGRPLSGVPVTYFTNSFGAFITSQSAFTDSEGYAQGTAIAPATTGLWQVTVTAGSGSVITGVFNLNSGTGSTGTTGAISARSGNGQVIRESGVTPELLRVVVKDTSGNPVPNAIVNWSVNTINGPNGSLSVTQSITDFNGEATNSYIAPILGPNLLASYIQSTITASTFSGSVNMYVTVIPVVFGQSLAALPTVQIVQPAGVDTITAQAGTTLIGAIQVRVTAGSGPGAGAPIPNVGISVTTGLDPNFATTARCSDNSGLTDGNGFATCDLVLGGKIGTASLSIGAGGQQVTSINLVVTPGLPGKLATVQGDNQSGLPGAQLPLALVALVSDNYGNLLPNAAVSWVIESGSGTLVNPINRSDSTARVSTLLRLGNTPGQVRVRVTAVGGLSTATLTFTATVNITATNIQRVSGDGQTAIVNTAFPSPLVATVVDANGAGVPGIVVSFAVNSGSAILSNNAVTSDGNGRVSVNVTAGGTAGPVTISATFSNSTVSWTLTVQPLGPAFTPESITSLAGGAVGIAPGAIVTIRGTNIVPSVRGTVFPSLLLGPLPTVLAGASVTFGGVAAPIFWVTNDSVTGEAITVQVPFEAPNGQSIPVTVSSGSASSSVNVIVSNVLPGIFESSDAQGNKWAVVVRNDGSFVTPGNPIGRGEQARVYMSGLGRTTAAGNTNTPGAGQRVNGTVVIGINDAGVRVISATLAPNLIGVYEVLFEVPADATTGNARSFGGFIDPGTGPVYANGTTIAIR